MMVIKGKVQMIPKLLRVSSERREGVVGRLVSDPLAHFSLTSAGAKKRRCYIR